MVKEALQLAPEWLPYVSIAAGMLGMALTRKQREAILERDDYQSQMRHYSEQRGWYTEGDNGTGLQVHHIIPQRMGGQDVPENLITLNASEHIGHGAKPGDFIVHPDIITARMNYPVLGEQAFQQIFHARDEAISRGEIYWNTDHDAEMKETAEERTRAAAANGWKFPHR